MIVRVFRHSSAASYCTPWCCFISLLIALLIGAGLAVALVFIIRSTNNDDSINSRKFQISKNQNLSHFKFENDTIEQMFSLSDMYKHNYYFSCCISCYSTSENYYRHHCTVNYDNHRHYDYYRYYDYYHNNLNL